jgi:opacity protein-like surface antigen
MKKDRKIPSGLALMGLLLVIPTAALGNDGLTGFYGVVETGVGIIESEGAILTGPFDETDQSGIIGGAIGYRMAVSDETPIVIGVEASADYYVDPSAWRYGVYGMAGVRVRESDLAYIRVGYGDLNRDDGDLDGMVYGGGYELSLNNGTAMRLDYRYLSYDDMNYPDATIDFTGHEVTLAFVGRF